LLVPPPRECQVRPSHAAIFEAEADPAVANEPPTTRRGDSGPAPSGSHAVALKTGPSRLDRGGFACQLKLQSKADAGAGHSKAGIAALIPPRTNPIDLDRAN